MQLHACSDCNADLAQQQSDMAFLATVWLPLKAMAFCSCRAAFHSCCKPPPWALVSTVASYLATPNNTPIPTQFFCRTCSCNASLSASAAASRASPSTSMTCLAVALCPLPLAVASSCCSKAATRRCRARFCCFTCSNCTHWSHRRRQGMTGPR